MSTVKPFVFVLMPFESSFDDIYKVGIKAVCKELDIYCERVDEQIFEENILDRIYNQIIKSDIVIADMTGKNPNVFYEVGYAHALNKRVILLTQKTDDIPFDLKHYSHIVYEGKIVKLKEELTKRIEWFLKNPSQKELPNEFNIELYIDGNKLDVGKTINLTKHSNWRSEGIAHNGNSAFPLKFDIYNNSNRVFNSKFKIGIITHEFIGNQQQDPRAISFVINDKNVIKLNDKDYLHVSKDFSNMYPFSWKSFNITLISDIVDAAVDGKQINITVRIFTEFGIKDYPIKIILPIKIEEDLF